MAGELTMPVVGNISEVELRFTPGGAAVCKFAIASTPRRMNRETNKWEDGDTSWVNCVVWRDLAEHCAASFERGTRVIALGRWAARSYEDKEGNKRTVWEFTVDAIGPELTWATAVVTKTSSGGTTRNTGPDAFEGTTKERPAAGATQQQAPASAETQRAAQAAGEVADEPPW